MTVAELIAELQKFDSSLTVYWTGDFSEEIYEADDRWQPHGLRYRDPNKKDKGWVYCRGSEKADMGVRID